MGWRGTPLADAAARIARERIPRTPRLAIVLAALAGPAIAIAHERWVPHQRRFPVNRAYFQSMSGEVLLFSLGATIAVFGLVVFWYLTAPGILDALTPVTQAAKSREASRGFLSRGARLFVRLILDGDLDSPFMRGGLRVATFVFARIPAFVLVLGAIQGWLVMPSFPLDDNEIGTALRVVQVVLAIWIAIGLFVRPLGPIMMLVFVYLCIQYGIAGIDAIPVLASAFYYLFKKRGSDVNGRQLLGVRLSLGVGFFLLGLINKILLGPDLFIGVGDQHPDLLIGPQAMFPGLTREAWCFTTALGEMVFGLLLLIGTWNRITTIVLSFVFANFILVFGAAEIVHVYPIAGFLFLFFRGPSGTSLDGLVFRANLGFWRKLRTSSSRVVYGSAVLTIALFSAAILMFTPLLVITELAPDLAGIAVPANYKPPPLPPPASKWASLPTATPTAPQPHADHEPRHGGVVTMTGDNHIEICVRRDGLIQLYASDAVRAPIPAREVSGTIRIELVQRPPGKPVTLRLTPDATDALAVMGPAPRVLADYTYDLKIRGVASSQTLRIQPGGTEHPRK